MRLFLDVSNMKDNLLDFWKLRNLYECARVALLASALECCGSTFCCSFLRERERVHLSPHIPFDPAFARWAPVWLASMAPPLRRQSEFQEFAIDYKTVFTIFFLLIGSKQCHLERITSYEDIYVLIRWQIGGKSHYRCYVLNPNVAIDRSCVATILLEFNKYDDI